MSTAKADTFEEQEILPGQAIAIAAPYRHGYSLVVIEQLADKEKCWSEQGSAPVIVDPLLMNFDFTNHCRRATDSNGYSVRIAGKEKGTDYLLNIEERDNELILVATQRDPNKKPLIIGRTHGLQKGITKIFLNSGWRLTRRSYQGQELSHFYFSEDFSHIANSDSHLQ